MEPPPAGKSFTTDANVDHPSAPDELHSEDNDSPVVERTELAPGESERTGRVAAEDVILYAFSGALLILLGFFFHLQTTHLKDGLLTGNPASESEEFGLITEDADRSFMAAQLHLTVRRYRLAAALAYTKTARANAGFLIGSLMALLGALIVVRRVRETPTGADWEAAKVLSLKFATSSPGLVLAFLGTLVIVSSILSVSERSVSVRDSRILHPKMVLLPETQADEARADTRDAIEALDRLTPPNPENSPFRVPEQ